MPSWPVANIYKNQQVRGNEKMAKKDKFIKLTDYDNDSIVYINPEVITEITGLAKTDKHTARTSPESLTKC